MTSFETATGPTLERYALVPGTANRPLAESVARELRAPLCKCTVERFPDGEVSVLIEESVRGRDVFLLQPTSPPVNDHLVELLVLADACRRAAAARISAIVPYFGYARSDRRQGRRAPITASLAATVAETAGIDHVVVLDAHSPQLEGFFRVPIDNLSAVPAICDALAERVDGDAVVVSPDLGAVRLAAEYGRRLGLPTAVCHKQRTSAREASVSRIVGEARGRRCIIVDDMITTGGTIAAAIAALTEAGARGDMTVAATHAVLTAGARERLAAAGVRELFVSDSIVQPMDGEPKLRVVSVAATIADVVRRVTADASLHAAGPLAYA
jgi:ribose-phosphate pyrophosphokinase